VKRNLVGPSLAALLLFSGMACGVGITSSLQAGDSVIPFDVLNCNGPSAGKTNCQI